MRAVWVSEAAESASHKFAVTLVGLEDLESHLATMAAFERSTATRLDQTLAPGPELVATIARRYSLFLKLDDEVLPSMPKSPTKLSLWSWLPQLSLVTSAHLAFNEAYQSFCAVMESGYRSLTAIRDQYTEYARTLRACPVLTQAYPEMPSRY